MLPLWFFAAMVVVTLSAFAADRLLRRRRARILRALAAQWHMHYAQNDQFQITPRVVERFPVPGVSDLQVTDLIYLPERECYRYLFTVEYTVGVVRTKKRVRRVGTFCEPRDRACPEGWTPLILAEAGLPLADQYRQLHPQDPPAAVPAVAREVVPTPDSKSDILQGESERWTHDSSHEDEPLAQTGSEAQEASAKVAERAERLDEREP